MDQYIPEFSARDVDGRELLQMDGAKLKVRSSVVSERTHRFSLLGALALSGRVLFRRVWACSVRPTAAL